MSIPTRKFPNEYYSVPNKLNNSEDKIESRNAPMTIDIKNLTLVPNHLDEFFDNSEPDEKSEKRKRN